MMMLHSRVLIASFAAAVLAGTALAGDGGKKVIALSWGLGYRTIDEIADHADELAAMGIDGVDIGVRIPEVNAGTGKLMSWRSPVYGTAGFTNETRMLEAVPAFKRLNATKVNCNFVSISLFFDKWNSYADDAFWACACHKAAMLTRVAKLSGCKGVFIDTEDYPHVGQFYYIPKFAKHGFEKTAELARQRGREFMSAMVKEYPDMEILTTWLLSNQSRGSYQDLYNGPEAAWRKNGDLFVPFMRGMVEALGPKTMLHDGNEAGYYCEASRREFFYDYCAIRNLGRELMSDDLKDKYNAQVRAGFGLYLDSYTLPLKNGWAKGEVEGCRLKHHELNFKQAWESTDKYVWLWGEHFAFAHWTNTLVKTHSNLPTWESQLPGISLMQRFVKDPKGVGEELYRAKLARGEKLENLLKYDGSCVEVSNKSGTMKGTGVKGFGTTFGRDRKDGFTGKWEYVKDGHGGKPGMRQSGTFGASLSFPGYAKLGENYGAIYRASVWFKTSPAGRFAVEPELKVGKVTRNHPIWNDGGGWMAAHFKADVGHGTSVTAGEPDKDGWREAVVYFRADAFDWSASFSAGVGRRLWEGEWAIISDPQLVRVSDPIPEPQKDEDADPNGLPEL